MISPRNRGDRHQIDVWPGWVDALSSLLIIIIFVLMVFLVAQFYLSTLLSGQDEAVARLTRQIGELETQLEVEREAARTERGRADRLAQTLQDTIAEREGLDQALSTAEGRQATLEQRLADAVRQIEALTGDGSDRDRQLAAAASALEESRQVVEEQLRQIASLQADIQTLRSVKDDLELKVAALGRSLEESQASAEVARQDQERIRVELDLTAEARDRLLEEMTTLRDRSTELEARLLDAEERTALAEREIEDRGTRIASLEQSLTDQTSETERISTEAAALAARLNTRIEELQQQLARVEAALEASESRVSERDVEIANLNSRLNQALVRRVEELNRYRSEFFGRLRESLANRPEIRIVGDRFIFQSEVLFTSGSADLQLGGQVELARFADLLLQITRELPSDVDWLLRIDGHTDVNPVRGGPFRSNWDLSTARALSVLEFLASSGVPENRMAAAGFGEFQPLDRGSSPEALARNRRIELTIDQRLE